MGEVDPIECTLYATSGLNPRIECFEKFKVLDPSWPDMWYLNRNLKNSSLPDLNVTTAWELGYTGKGVIITFLDDGLEWDHPDIFENFEQSASKNLLDNKDDPRPDYSHYVQNHGTRSAGIVGSLANNNLCTIGIAFNSRIGAIRILSDQAVSDSLLAQALEFNREKIHIYCSSFGPPDLELIEPGPKTKTALREGVNKGRKGLGSIYIWASGNGGEFEDSCAYDGYINSIYTFSISATTENGNKPSYTEECSSILATTFSSGSPEEKSIYSIDIKGECTSDHSGTSAAAPIAAGIIALTLEANPKLTWRDVMFITVLTSRAKAIVSNNYIQNKRGLLVSSRYGFGLMDAGRMVEVAKNWVNVPKMVTCDVQSFDYLVKTRKLFGITEVRLFTNSCQGTRNEINYIEQIEIVVSILVKIRGFLEFNITSPMGTKSQILQVRKYDNSPEGFVKWTFMSVYFWGENPKGEWILNFGSIDASIVEMSELNLKIHGTKNKPCEYEKYF
ncbi:unnamed protein product [Brachionus calyciflorus]|uniref:P/Homo B domain-containing protein n=1 Tax=Brachionus calyciflorus TaxID=104777 RepID=A0A813P620_9BILA|nr:unnamed protein product [Brachionus calyciflorus]